MKSYLSIPKATPVDLPCIVFKKYDGSNIRAEWNPKRGWYKFGTRTRLLDKSDKVFGEAIDIFNNKLGDYIIQQLSTVYKSSKQFYKIDNKLTSVVAFAEFYGKNSMFGKLKTKRWLSLLRSFHPEDWEQYE